MPEINQYTFSVKELTEILIKNADIHEGSWMLSVGMGFSAINIGPEGAHRPAGIVIFDAVGIQRVQEGETPPPELVVNATSVNPRRNKANT